MKNNILWQIFFDEHNNWEKFVEKYGNRIRKVVIKEVEKFRHCGDPKHGFRLFVCEGCNELKVLPYRCKSRFCTSCSCGEVEEWSRVIAQDAYQVIHRHIFLTIDEGLRNVFAKHRKLLKDLMDEAVELIKGYIEKKYKVTPGIIAGLHTFGAKLEFNPQVHMMVTMGGMKETGEWITKDFIPFTMLRKQWQTVVLKMLRKKLSEAEKKRIQPLLQKAWKENEDGFFIYAPKQKGNVKEQLRYIARYIRKPAIGMNRIVTYEEGKVVIKYVDKRDGKEKQEEMSVEEFIGRIIKHIADEQFKVIRHYGVYARRIKELCRKLVGEWSKQVHRWIVAFKRLKRRSWAERQKEETGKDPMICERCGNYFEYKGEVCLKAGKLAVKYARGEMARKCLERLIEDVTGIKEEEKRREKRPRENPRPAEKYSEIYLFAV
jgi:glycosyltransferase involved in cell wall biosynthesis